ncbi:MAG: hypothetical protein JSS89_05740 [Bacteroidetes bacterium]|nr:hypothetical protein [Bacteroidota bacterium]
MNKPDLIEELMSTKKLNAFFDETERSMVTMMGAPATESAARRGVWWIVGGAAGLALIGSTVWMTLRSDSSDMATVSTTRTAAVSEQAPNTTMAPVPASSGTNQRVQMNTQAMPSAAPVPTSTQDASRQADHMMIAQADATPTIESATRREIDSLSTMLESMQSPLDKARLAYQIGIRQRLHGDVDAAIASLATARSLAQSSHATVLEARSLAEQSRCEAKRGRIGEAQTLLESAIRLLSDRNDSLRQQWRIERDALAR